MKCLASYYKFLPLFIMLSACAANPKVVAIENGNERSLSCEDLQNEMRSAASYKVEARKEDTFQWKYLFSPSTAMLSVYRMSKAEDAAGKREKVLNDIAQVKGCPFAYGQMQQAYMPQPPMLPPAMPQAPVPAGMSAMEYPSQQQTVAANINPSYYPYNSPYQSFYK